MKPDRALKISGLLFLLTLALGVVLGPASGSTRLSPPLGPAAHEPQQQPQTLQVEQARFATILCRFAGTTTTTPHTKSWYELVMGQIYPGLGDYWAEASYGQVSLAGSAVFGCYDLAKDQAAYYDASGAFLHETFVHDCAARADADIAFANFDYINAVANTNPSRNGFPNFGYSGRVFGYTQDLDGQNRRTLAVISFGSSTSYIFHHELGHVFGSVHTSGPYGKVLDSGWDSISDGSESSYPADLTISVPVHPNASNKMNAGWISGSQIYVHSGMGTTIVLNPLGAPPPSSGYMMARVPIGSSTTRFYTVEARRRTGNYEKNIPGDAVVIHDVDTTRPDAEAFVVDPDNNQNPNDAGAMWPVGEKYTDTANGIEIAVLAERPGGEYWVYIGSPGTAPAATPLPSPSGSQSPSPEPSNAEPSPSPGDDTTPVDHARSVSLRLRGHVAASGQVAVTDAFQSCWSFVRVNIQRRFASGWKRIAYTTADIDGIFKILLPDQTGRFRARLPRHEIEGHSCLRATSPIRRHLH